MAYGSDIFIYEPRFPSQELPRQPSLVLSSSPSRPDLSGYLDPREPHTINNLVVQFLGNEEVVAVVRDDGDVEAYLTRHVYQAVQKRAESGNTLGAKADDVRAFFHNNVGISAWGLAVHSEARMIAVSSNAHEVRVFAFALVGDRDGETQHAEDDQEDDQDEAGPDAVPSSGFTQRSKDVMRIMMNGKANVPHISFCNTGDDPKGRWLLTTDISGFTRTVDIHALCIVQEFRFGPHFHSGRGDYDRLNAGWLATFLDTRSFMPVDRPHKALGMEESELKKALESDSRIWDISSTVSRVPDTAETFPPAKKRRVASPGRVRRSTSVVPPAISAVSQDIGESSDDEDTGVPLNEEIPGESHDSESQDGPESLQDTETESEIAGVDYEDDYEATDDFISPDNYYGGTTITGFRPLFQKRTDLCDDLPCPIMHASIRNVYLLQPSNQTYVKGPFYPPMVGLANPTKQTISYAYSQLNMFDRLNLHAQIPSLGVMILASQKGRAVVLSLTKIPASAVYPGPAETHGNKPTYAFRVDHLLPFASQECIEDEDFNIDRPFAPLHGIAVGPMQGTEHLPQDQKRWRLLMMYQNHSVLSYEIGRRRDRKVSVTDLVI